MNYYCRYCRNKASSIASLTGSSCPRHPSGGNKGKHALYEGAEKSRYECKYCQTSVKAPFSDPEYRKSISRFWTAAVTRET